MADKWTKSATLKILRGFFGPLARLDKMGDEFVASIQFGDRRMVLGSGGTPYEVFHEAILLPVKMKEARDAMMQELPGFQNASESPEMGQGDVTRGGGATPLATIPPQTL